MKNKGNGTNNLGTKEDLTTLAKIGVVDIERENRLSKVISLYSKGLNQEEIARELRIDQSTVSRDLQYIKQEARKQIEKYLREDILFEYVRYMAGSNEITRQRYHYVLCRHKCNHTIVIFKHLLQAQNHI